MKAIQETEQKEQQVPSEISELELPFEEDFLPENFPFITGEPGLGRDKDIVGTKSPHYVSSHILGRLF